MDIDARFLFLLILICCSNCQNTVPVDSACGECDVSNCPTKKSTECIAGFTKDKCNCCQICAKAEGDFCDLPGDVHQYGHCGAHLVCVRQATGTGICVCENQDVVCGSDDIEYKTICKLREDKIRTDNEDLIVQYVGPCKAAPIIISGPDSVRNLTGDDIVLLCEAYGNPVPSLSWTFRRVDGQIVSLPGDDDSISMISRGGPEEMQVTGWLQIVHAEKRHEGDYTCKAQTEKGTDEKTGRVKILHHEKVLNRVKRKDEGEL